MKRTRFLLVLLSIALALALPASAGDGAAEAAISALGTANASLRRSVLDNGMICLTKEDHSAPVVSVQIWVGTGAIHEEEHLGAGLSHAIEHMIFKGTEKRGVGAISRDIDEAGGRINAYTSFDRTVFHADLPAAKWVVGLDVLSDAVMHAAFPEAEWEKERQVILREIAMGRDDPMRVISKLLWSTAYRTHPYRFPVIGYEDVFRDITREDLADFCRRNYVPDNMIVAIVGDIDATEVEAAVRQTFADFPRRARRPTVLPMEPPQLSPRFARKTGSYNITRLEWAYHTVPLSHPDAPALDLLAVIVGRGRSSRLSRTLKEDQRLVHSIRAWSYTPAQPGLFGLSASFDPDKEQEVLTAIQKETESWAGTRFRNAEIDKARRMLLSSELSELQTMKGQAGNYASGEFYAGNPRFSEAYLDQLAKVSPAVLKQVAARYLRPEGRTVALVAPERVAEADPTEREETTVAMPMPEKILLSSAMPLLVREDHRLPFVYFCVAFGGGLLSETEPVNGVTRLMSDLLVRGNKRRSAEDIALEVESRGGQLSPFSGHNSFGLQAKCFSTDADTFMGLLADCLLTPTFPEDEISKQIVVQCAAIEAQRERPFFLAQEQLASLIFPDHPYRWTPLGQTNSVAALSRKDIAAHHARHMVSGNAVLAIFGDITPDKARELAERHLARLPIAAPPTRHEEAAHPILPTRAERREPKEQAIVLIGAPGLTVNAPRTDALRVLDTALSGLSSDLAHAVREERGLAYYVGAYHRPGLSPGVFVLYAGTQPGSESDVEDMMRSEIARISTQGLRADEFGRARDQIIAAHQMSLQDNLGLALTCALDELYGLGGEHAFQTEARFRALTPEDVRAAAAAVLATNRLAVSVLLPNKGD